MSAVEVGVHNITRAGELGLPEGTGKMYSRADLEKRFGRMTPDQRFRDFLGGQHEGQLFFRGHHDKKVLHDFWTEELKRGRVDDAEKLFYLGVDIMRMNLGNDWHDEPLQYSHNPALTLYTKEGHTQTRFEMRFNYPIFVTSSQFVQIHIDTPQDRGFIDERYEVVRRPTVWKGETAKDASRFGFGVPMTYPWKEGHMHTLLQVEFSKGQYQDFAQRLMNASNYAASNPGAAIAA